MHQNLYVCLSVHPCIRPSVSIDPKALYNAKTKQATTLNGVWWVTSTIMFEKPTHLFFNEMWTKFFLLFSCWPSWLMVNSRLSLTGAKSGISYSACPCKNIKEISQIQIFSDIPLASPTVTLAAHIVST